VTATPLLNELLQQTAGDLRPAKQVASPQWLGATRQTRLSFSRSMLRRAQDHHWQGEQITSDLDQQGRGHLVYRIEAEGYLFHFVAFTTTLDESQHTDRVIADAWEISAALIEGPLTDDLFTSLSTEVPAQEDGRFDPRVLVLARGNRSVRFYDLIVGHLAAGRQPPVDQAADAGYLLRSTAFYGNGKFGLRSFLSFEKNHPLAAPYRAQFLAAWLFREVGYDTVEHCAQVKSPETAVAFDSQWRCFFGVGNATGLGLVPWAVRHPKIMNAWVGVRELALAKVRSKTGSSPDNLTLEKCFNRAAQHFSSLGGEDRHPWRGPDWLAQRVQEVAGVWEELKAEPLPYDALYRWAEQQPPEATELVVSLLLELDQTPDELIDQLLLTEESSPPPTALTVGEACALLEQKYSWLEETGVKNAHADHYWWAVSDNTAEPRRANRRFVDPEHREVPIDLLLRLHRLEQDLTTADPALALDTFRQEFPHHGLAIDRLVDDLGPYGEARDNVCAQDHLPLNLQRFQLAMYGMDNFTPQSTDWLRVTLFQGAPRLTDLSTGLTDQWVWPPCPSGETNDH